MKYGSRYLEKVPKTEKQYLQMENICVMLKITGRHGKPIANYSHFVTEKEFLFEPNSTFLVKRRVDEKEKYLCEFRVYELE